MRCFKEDHGPTCSVLNSCKRVLRPFFAGKKPSKTKRSMGSAEATKAGKTADAPGKHSTSTPCCTHSRTSKNPGSLTPGIPASLIKAICTPLLEFIHDPVELLVFIEGMEGLHPCGDLIMPKKFSAVARIFCQYEVHLLQDPDRSKSRIF